MGKLLGNGQL